MALTLIKNTASKTRGFLYKDDYGLSSCFRYRCGYQLLALLCIVPSDDGSRQPKYMYTEYLLRCGLKNPQIVYLQCMYKKAQDINNST